MSLRSMHILYMSDYNDYDFQLVINKEQHIEYKIFSMEKKFLTKDLNSLLSMCRTIINEEHIQIILSDSCRNQLIIAKLMDEYPRIYNRGMKFLNTFKCMNRFLIIDLFGIEQCIPTLLIDLTNDWKENFEKIKVFFEKNNKNGYVKSLYSSDNQLSSFRFQNWQNFIAHIENYMEFYQEQYSTNFLPLFRVYLPKNEYPWIFKPHYLIQPFYDLITYPHWRLVIANACIYDKEILMWPLVDGYSGWPFLAEKPLSILPIIVCPGRQISPEQQHLLYTRFREHLNYLINHFNLNSGWIECSYFISCTNEIRLVSIKPTCSIYLIEAFHCTNQYGNPVQTLIQLSNHQKPQTPILNGKTVYIHRLWTNIEENISINDLINMNEIKRIGRSNRYIRLRYQENEIVKKDPSKIYTEIGFIQVYGQYYELGLTNLIEFRYNLLKKPDIFPFIHHSLLLTNQNDFDPLTCLPSDELLSQLENLRQKEQKDLI